MTDVSGQDRRLHPRATVHLPVTVMVNRRPVPGELINISVGGLLFQTRIEVTTEAAIEVTLSVAPDRQCMGAGSVVRSGHGIGFGVEFSTMNDAMSEFVTDLLTLRDDLRSDFLSSVVNPMVVVKAAQA